MATGKKRVYPDAPKYVCDLCDEITRFTKTSGKQIVVGDNYMRWDTNEFGSIYVSYNADTNLHYSFVMNRVQVATKGFVKTPRSLKRRLMAYIARVLKASDKRRKVLHEEAQMLAFANQRLSTLHSMLDFELNCIKG